jgi:hypothetical protein
MVSALDPIAHPEASTCPLPTISLHGKARMVEDGACYERTNITIHMYIIWLTVRQPCQTFQKCLLWPTIKSRAVPSPSSRWKAEFRTLKHDRHVFHLIARFSGGKQQFIATDVRCGNRRLAQSFCRLSFCRLSRQAARNRIRSSEEDKKIIDKKSGWENRIEEFLAAG